MNRGYHLTMTHYWCEFGNSALICSDVITWTRLCKVVHLSVEGRNDLDSHGQGHSYWIEVINLPWYKITVNLATLHLFVQKLLGGQDFVSCALISKITNVLEGQGQGGSFSIVAISPSYTLFLWIWQDCIDLFKRYCAGNSGSIKSHWKSKSGMSILPRGY